MVKQRSSSELIHLLLKSLVVVCIMGLSLGLVLTLVIVGTATRYLSTFMASSNITFSEVSSLALDGFQNQISLPDDRYNVLVLGTDYLSTRGDAPVLTDTVMLISLNVKTGKVSLISFPRDIYFPELGLKINALYQDARTKGSTQPEKATETKVEALTGIPIHRTVLITLEQVSQMIDAVGGVEIEVTEGFTDPRFPRPDVDVTVERDPSKLYKTITFEPGWQTMSGERALEYIRSRHSSGTQGNDLARNARQQQVFMTLIATLQQKQLWLDPNKAGTLYHFYARNWEQSLPTTELFAVGKHLAQHQPAISFQTYTLSEYPYDPQGMLYHPPLWETNGHWAFLIRDERLFKEFIQTTLP